MTMIQNDRVILRAPEPDDVDALYLWENDAPDTLNEPLSRLAVWTYVHDYKADIYSRRELRLMIDYAVTGATIGHIDLVEFDPTHRRAGIGIYIAEEYRHCGFAAEAVGLLSEYCHNTLHMKQLWAQVAADNVASLALFISAGFAEVATLPFWFRRGDRYVDVKIFTKIFA